MRLSISALFQSGAINCHHISYDDEIDAPIIMPAQAVFITESTVTRAREIEAGFELHDSEIRRQEFSYGDIVVASVDDAGNTIGSIAHGGQDAGICLLVNRNGSNAYMPFSGENMFMAKAFLSGEVRSGRELDENESKALTSIEEVFAMAIASPDPDRFPEAIRGMAARSILLEEYADVSLGVSDAELMRYLRGTSLRNEISRLDPTHPDASQSRTSHADLLAGMEAQALPGANFRNIVSLRVDNLGSRVSHANDVLLRNIFGSMTNTPLEELSVSILDTAQVASIRESLSGSRLTGDWIDGVKAHVSQALRNGPLTATGGGAHAYRYDMDVYENAGRDILLVTDSVNGAAARSGYIYSWPTADRQLVAEFNGQNFATISPESVPSEDDLIRLSRIVDDLNQAMAPDVENFDM